MLGFSKDLLKNLIGWRTKRKIIVFVIDDYGNVRLHSKKSRDKLDAKSLVPSRFDLYDSMETREDLERLFDLLQSVKNLRSKNPKLTFYAVPCNLDFEEIIKENYERLHFEELPVTFDKLSYYDPINYEGTWRLWNEGLSYGLFEVQFHGREHFNVNQLDVKLRERDFSLLNSIDNRSLAFISSSKYPTIEWSSSFSFWDPLQEKNRFDEILTAGISKFSEVFKNSPIAFTPPGQELPMEIESSLNRYGFLTFDKPFYRNRHIGFGKRSKEFSFTRYDRKNKIVIMVRNVFFEPTNRQGDHVGNALNQIKAAFALNRPAVISSHRVNYGTYIDMNNGLKGLKSLRELILGIIDQWPSVEFLFVSELTGLINGTSEI